MNWWEKPLDALSAAEWEALCDGCGRCCMHRFEDEDTGELTATNVACRLLDVAQCRCTDYARRFERVPDCLNVRDLAPDEYRWLPETCAYRLRFEGRPLPEWHPWVAGNDRAMIEAGISMRGCCISETDCGGVDAMMRALSSPGDD